MRFREHLDQMVHNARSAALRDANLEEPDRPEEDVPKLPAELAELTDSQMMSLFSRFTRWADYFSVLVALDEVKEKFAEDEVRRLEDLFMLANRPERPQSGELTMIKASMEGDAEIAAARQEFRVVYAHRKLIQVFFEAAERDAAVLSRELTRRTEMEPYNRRADRRGA